MAPHARQWYRFEMAAADPAVADIHIIDFIGDWIDELINEIYSIKATLTAKAFVDLLSKLPDAVKTIRVHINSPGGDVFAAVNIANALREQQTSKARAVETIVEGLAASAASIIMMAGQKVTMADNALVMVHNPWTIAVGNSADMRKSADTLDTIRKAIVATYQWHSSLKDAEIIALMDAETWMSADEAIANGLATEKVSGLKAAASIDLRSFATLKVPDQFKARCQELVKKDPPAPAAASAIDVLTAVEAAGLGTACARDLVAAALPIDQVNARIATASAARAQAATRATEIRALCATAKLTELADGYIAGAMASADVRAHLTTVTAKMDRAEIDGGINPDQRSRQKPTIDVAAVYATRNSLTTKKE